MIKIPLRTLVSATYFMETFKNNFRENRQSTLK